MALHPTLEMNMTCEIELSNGTHLVVDGNEDGLLVEAARDEDGNELDPDSVPITREVRDLVERATERDNTFENSHIYFSEYP
jgi:hypothetical protein